MNSPNQIYLNQIIPNQIIGGDAFELLPKIKDDSIDLIVCDGPFGVTDQKWDKISDIQQFNLKLITIFSQKLKKEGTLSHLCLCANSTSCGTRTSSKLKVFAFLPLVK